MQGVHATKLFQRHWLTSATSPFPKGPFVADQHPAMGHLVSSLAATKGPGNNLAYNARGVLWRYRSLLISVTTLSAPYTTASSVDFVRH